MRVLVAKGADSRNSYCTRKVIGGHSRGKGQGTGRLNGMVNGLKKRCVLCLRLGALGTSVRDIGNTSKNRRGSGGHCIRRWNGKTWSRGLKPGIVLQSRSFMGPLWSQTWLANNRWNLRRWGLRCTDCGCIGVRTVMLVERKTRWMRGWKVEGLQEWLWILPYLSGMCAKIKPQAYQIRLQRV